MKLEVAVNVYFHDSDTSGARFDRIDRVLAAVLRQGFNMTQLVDDVVAAVAKIGPAINALEAKITEVLANSGMSQADKDALTQAVADLKAAFDDASDGVDEAAPPAP